MTEYEIWDERRKMMFHFACLILEGRGEPVSPLASIESVANQAARLTDKLIEHLGPAPEKDQDKHCAQQPSPDEYAAMVFSGVSRRLGDTLHESAACLKEAARKVGPP